MHNASLYKKSNEMQRRDAKQTIDEFLPNVRWRKDGCDSILDIGSGSADVMMDFILPILPPNFQILVGVDASEEMVEYARRNYSRPRVSFEKLTIGIDIDKQPFRYEPFDHITSFHCLHWVRDQKCAVRNLYKLLKPDGDMLVAFLTHHPIYDIYKKMSQNSKWAKYMTDVNNYISPYQHSMDPVEQFRKLLSSNGFKHNTVEVHEKSYIFEGIDILKSR